MSHHDVPSEVVIITPSGKAHKGIQHESGAMETPPACHISGDTDVNQIMEAKAFKGEAKKKADLCDRCFAD